LSCVPSKPQELHSGVDVLKEDAIEAMRVGTAYDVVARSHSEYLHSRGRESLDARTPAVPAHVFLDDTFYGDIATLKQIPASQVSEMRFFQAYEAQYKFGTGHMGGVIQVITKQ
jgi:hypothetical protein